MMSNALDSREHEFTLVLDGVHELNAEVETALFDAGCDDATISMRARRMFLTFCRTAPSLKDAIISALRAVADANIGARVLRVDECDLVTQADIGRRIGRTRQLVYQYIMGLRGPGDFPPPACEISTGSPLWYWCEVARWLWENDMIHESVMRDAEEVDVINSVLQLQWKRLLTPELTDEILRFVKFCGDPDCRVEK